MTIEIKKNQDGLFNIIVDGKLEYSDLTYEQVSDTTLGELDRVDVLESEV